MADNVPQLVQRLPQELYDHVFALTFTSSGGMISITNTLRPPSTLQVDRNTRLQVAQGYYGSSTFHCTDRETLVAWLAHLPRSHLQSLGSVTLKVSSGLADVAQFSDRNISQNPGIQQLVAEAAQDGVIFDQPGLQSFCTFFQSRLREDVGRDVAEKERDGVEDGFVEAAGWSFGRPDWLTVEVEGLGKYFMAHYGGSAAWDWRSV